MGKWEGYLSNYQNFCEKLAIFAGYLSNYKKSSINKKNGNFALSKK
jgi:hypothetical protein